MTALHYAAKAGHVGIIKVLLDTDGLDIDVKVNTFCTLKGQHIALSSRNLVGTNSQQLLTQFQRNFIGTFSIKSRCAYSYYVMIG